MWKLIFILPVITLNTFAQYSLEQIVISSQSDSTSRYITSSTQIVENEKVQKENLVIDVLRNTAGVHINQSGAMGSLSSIHIRGSEFRHVVVLIDGIRIYDPSSTDRIVDLSFLNTEDIEKVEILKGAQGILYGADAIGGVINIITKKKIGVSKKQLTFGSGAINKIAANFSKSESKNTIYFNTQLEQSKFISSAKGGEEKDGYSSKSATLNWTNILDDSWGSTILLKYLESEADTDAGAFIDDSSSRSFRQQKILGWILSHEGELFQFENQLSLNTHNRKSISSYGEYPFQGENFTQQAKLTFLDGENKYLIGLRFDNESMKAKDTSNLSNSLIGFYGQTLLKSKHLFTNFGLRSDFHEQLGNVTSFSFGVGKELSSNWVLKSDFATGFKPPSLYQLYANDITAMMNCKVGNLNLRPEASESAQLSLSNHSFELAIFSTRVKDFIDYDCNKGYSNIRNFQSSGIELGYFNNITKHLSISTSALFAKYIRDGNLEVARRPSYEGKISLNYKLSDQFNLSLDQRVISKRYDYIANTEYVLAPYNLSDISLIYKKQSYEINMKLNNIFNESYEEAAGFNRPGFNGQLNVTFNI